MTFQIIYRGELLAEFNDLFQAEAFANGWLQAKGLTETWANRESMLRHDMAILECR